MSWAHSRRTRLGALFSRCDLTGRPDMPMLSVYRDYGVIPRDGRDNNYNKPGEDLSAYRVVRRGDLVLNKMQTWQGSLGISDYDGIVSPAYFVARPLTDDSPAFVHHLLRSRPLIAEYGARSKGIRPSQWDLPWDEFRTITVDLPPIATQLNIANYLDRETARIDALIAAKRRMVELLTERFAAFASLAGTGGVGELERRPSPSRMYGASPTAWSETPLRHLGCEVQTGPFGSQLHAEEYVEDGWPVVNPMNIVDGGIVSAPTMTITTDKRAELARHILQAGDIVFGRRGEMGRAGLVGPAQVGWLCGTGSLRLRFTGTALVPEYLTLLLQTPAAKAYFSLSSVGSTMENLNTEILLSFPTLVPSIAEQSAIVAEVERASAERDRLVRVLDRQSVLLAERRQALITAAVTGELDLPEAA